MSSEIIEQTQPRFQWRRVSLLILGLVVVSVGIAWKYNLLRLSGPGQRENAIMVIAPYRHQGTWVFDDNSAGLVQEPFVAGVPEMIDVIVKDIPTADEGFRLLFSAKPFPEYQKKLIWLRGDQGGNYYRFEDSEMEGWICPAMFKYYETAPKELYVKAEPKA
ncbi:DUF6717 family protein [uncultured Gimesia sp.]|uniref:DUF6717 family protein n=1 Tax=uncultured Gimesia sp. TaxID=1678688 RepID=UPI00261A5946|nr:DUF6717 family protein [uncultured Gimesia sp.]